MKILLISPFMSYKDRWGQYYEGAGDTFPQGLGIIAGYMEQNGYEVDVLEPDVMGMDKAAFCSFIEQGGYTLVGMSVFTPNVTFAYETADLIKSISSRILVVVGGAHPTLFPKETLKECPSIDFSVTNEGEVPMLRLAQCLDSDQPEFEAVPNLYYRTSGKIMSSKHKMEHWVDLDHLPIFPFHKFDMEKYIPAPSLRRVLPTFNYMAQRGCPFSCSFCDTRTHGKKVRYRSVDKVIDDLKYLKRTYGIRGVIFEGSNFTVSKKWITELCNRMINEKLNLLWYCMGRVDINLELLPLMKKAGLWAMSFGIETGNEKTLKMMKKKISLSQVKSTMTELNRLKIRSIGSLILGYPGENKQDVLNTIDYACSLGLDVAVFFNPVPYPGTVLYEHAQNDGGLIEDPPTWGAYKAWLDHNNPIYINPLLGDLQVKLYNYAFTKFYTRPSYIFSQLLRIRTLDDFKRLTRGFKSVNGLIVKGINSLKNDK